MSSLVSGKKDKKCLNCPVQLSINSKQCNGGIGTSLPSGWFRRAFGEPVLAASCPEDVVVISDSPSMISSDKTWVASAVKDWQLSKHSWNICYSPVNELMNYKHIENSVKAYDSAGPLKTITALLFK